MPKTPDDVLALLHTLFRTGLRLGETDFSFISGSPNTKSVAAAFGGVSAPSFYDNFSGARDELGVFAGVYGPFGGAESARNAARSISNFERFYNIPGYTAIKLTYSDAFGWIETQILNGSGSKLLNAWGQVTTPNGLSHPPDAPNFHWLTSSLGSSSQYYQYEYIPDTIGRTFVQYLAQMELIERTLLSKQGSSSYLDTVISRLTAVNNKLTQIHTDLNNANVNALIFAIGSPPSGTIAGNIKLYLAVPPAGDGFSVADVFAECYYSSVSGLTTTFEGIYCPDGKGGVATIQDGAQGMVYFDSADKARSIIATQVSVNLHYDIQP